MEGAIFNNHNAIRSEVHPLGAAKMIMLKLETSPEVFNVMLNE